MWWRKSSRAKPDPLCLERLIHLSAIRNHLLAEDISMGQGVAVNCIIEKNKSLCDLRLPMVIW